MTIDDWSDLRFRIALGQQLRGTILRVDRWGILVDLELPFKGFIDRLEVRNSVDQYKPGDDIDVVVMQFAEYNHQIRLRPLKEEERDQLR
jgi:ribosomal protein S1